MLYPVSVCVILSVIAIGMRCRYGLKKPRPQLYSWLEYVVLCPLFIGLAYWFFTVPLPRYIQAAIWLMPVSAALLLLSCVRSSGNEKRFIIVSCIVYAVVNFSLLSYLAKNRDAFTDVAFSGWHPIETPRLIEKRTLSGLVVYMPATGYQCWEGRLPCTPYSIPELRLRVPGELSSGFTVRGESSPASSASPGIERPVAENREKAVTAASNAPPDKMITLDCGNNAIMKLSPYPGRQVHDGQPRG